MIIIINSSNGWRQQQQQGALVWQWGAAGVTFLALAVTWQHSIGGNG